MITHGIGPYKTKLIDKLKSASYFVASYDESYLRCFPLHFCKTRWVEDEPVAERAIQIWWNVVKVIRYWLALSVSKRPRNNKSFDTLIKYHSDPLMICKFQFFKYVASVLKYFLVAFQTNKPMFPFLATAVEKLYRKCLTLFMKRDVVDGCPTSSLLKLDLEKKNTNTH